MGRDSLFLQTMKTFQDRDLQTFVGNLLRFGVIIAMVIVVAGMVLYLFAHGREQADYGTFREDGIFRAAAFWQGLKSGDSEAIMQLGVILLITTPIARVLFTMIGFWLEKDRLYTLIAFIVLCIIAYSLLFGVSGH